jgi:hypothetical protein
MSCSGHCPPRYDVCDDYGVWVVAYPVPNGRWESQDEAQDECNRRNYMGGMSDILGELKETITEEDALNFEANHRTHPECTCNAASKEAKRTA